MINIPVGLQLFSVREALAKDHLGTLEKVAQIGYKNVEFAFHNTSSDGRFEVEYTAKDLKKSMDTMGLRVVTSHVAHHPNLDWNEVIRYNVELGSEGVVIPIYFFKSRQDAIELAKWLNTSGKKCKDSGIQLYFHNHYHEFQRFEGQSIMDTLLENTDPEYVSFELDTFWAQRGGVDPVAYMEKLGNRCGLLHQKDLSATAHPVNLLEKVSGELDADKVFSAFNKEDFVEIGTGIMDIPSILRKAQELGSVKYIIVEQDVTVKDELVSVKESFDNIQKLLMQS
ncbi:sugar phosphate isomerase/epimerase [Paenibacillus sp. MZ04-78.2]|uniref:sugar phosphate isomerase/epimerase family protein n=1 Tax=Paenibacillus sp. MZ04-78.2 TaxID=2962034 RepID=UPI0020B794F3|nr:sugar phosphate isomerase/epimerase [Paenibacillus sp. MZ04-78.2]MCP3774467.1 sugar phosphate isomerase/epimerase [Paenibacillus sp. MZ04-78.2]